MLTMMHLDSSWSALPLNWAILFCEHVQTSKPIAEAMTVLRSLAVIPVALGVLRSELDAMIQDPDQTFRAFAANVQGKAETCEFKTTYNGTCSACQHPFAGTTYYTDERLRDVLLNGIADVDIVDIDWS